LSHRFIWYNAKSHDSIFDEVLTADQEKDTDGERDLAKAKFTLTECIVALVISLTLVSLIAIFLVSEIEPMVEEYGIPDNFMGLILVPLVEKAAEHLTAIDEAWDNQMVRCSVVQQTFHLLICYLAELRPVPLPWTFHPDSSFQRAFGHYGWLGSRQQPDGLEF
jgi:calcium/proton exchanger cax